MFRFPYCRERGYFTWDKVLTLRFSGSHPAICGVELQKIDDARTLFLCGNSTVVDQLVSPWSSWGQMIQHFFAPGVAVANYAESGLTSGNFLAMKRLAKLLTEVQPGDYVFIEFGHNDQKASSAVRDYPANLTAFRDQITAREAVPVFVTPTARQSENDPVTSIAGLAQTMRETAQSLGVLCIDLNSMVIDLKKALGSDTKYLYMHTAGDQTHFCEYGAYELARCVLKGIEETIPSLADSFKPDYISFVPSVPDPLDILEKELPPVAVGAPQSTSQRKTAAAFNIHGTAVHLTGHWRSPLTLIVYGINGKLTGTEVLRSHVGRKTVPSNLLRSIPPGTYILALIQERTVSEHIVFCRP